MDRRAIVLCARMLVLGGLLFAAVPVRADDDEEQARQCREQCRAEENACYADGGVSMIGFCRYAYESKTCTTKICVHSGFPMME